MANLITTRVVWHRRALDNLLKSPTGPVGRLLHKKGLAVLTAARGQVGVKTGKLKASLHMEHKRNAKGQYVRVGSPLKYAYAHHEGTKPHVITPDRKEYLRFSSKGRVVYSRVIMHPGTKPNRYLTDNLYLIR